MGMAAQAPRKRNHVNLKKNIYPTSRGGVLACALSAALSLSVATPTHAAESDTTSYTISLITCSPGHQIYELEGHTGVRIQGAGRDEIVNWGLFDFDSPGFIYRFVKGETDYMSGSVPTERFVNYYKAQGRGVTEHVLNLTAGEARDIVADIDNQLLPANRTYRYNYVYDNCATRAIQSVRRNVASDIRLGGGGTIAGESTTFRQAMRAYHQAYPWYQFGIDIALGADIDTIIPAYRLEFAPEALGNMVETGRLGNGRALVTSRNILAPPTSTSPETTPWWLTPLAVFWVLFAIAAVITRLDYVRRETTRWFDFIFYLALALGGCLVTFLVVVSEHEATTPNWNILWMEPLCIIAALAGRRPSTTAATFHWLNIAAIVAYGVIWISGIQSGNPAFIPILLTSAMRSANYIYYYRWAKRRRGGYRSFNYYGR